MYARWKNNVVSIWDHAITGTGATPIIQTAIKQRKDSCAIAAVSTHIAYNLRISYAFHAHVCTALPPGMLINHEKWEDEIVSATGVKMMNVWELLEEAIINGAPLLNGLKLKADKSFHFVNLDENVMKDRLNFFTIVAVINVHDDYSADGEKAYMGRDKATKEEGTNIQQTHAVVIVGVYKDDALFIGNEKKETLWIYQNSDGDPSKSLLGNGLSVMRHSLIVEAYCGETYGANEFLAKWAADRAKPHRERGRVNLNQAAGRGGGNNP